MILGQWKGPECIRLISKAKKVKIHAVSYICLAQAIKEKIKNEGLTLAKEPIVGIDNLTMDPATKRTCKLYIKEGNGKVEEG